ncbi:DUF3265 domain-containing protein [Photobacterium damselae]|nr:DUF3265 domain-containing protein [Photobacterium damselae]
MKQLTTCLGQLSNVWHFYYEFCLVFKMVCGGIIIECSYLNRAL